MDAKLIELGQRALACKEWRWMPGMHDLGGNVYLGRRAGAPEGVHMWAGFDRGGWEWHEDEFSLPDFSDPATVGCLLQLVREAYDNSRLFARPWGRTTADSRDSWSVPLPYDQIVYGQTEAEALIIALGWEHKKEDPAAVWWEQNKENT